MKNKMPIICATLVIAVFVLGCRGNVNQENESNLSASSVVSGEKYKIDTKESVVTWKGAMAIGSNFHTGYVHISKGELTIGDDQLVGGLVEVDMNTLEDEKHESDNGLINHLKDPDFFDVKRFPTSTFSITEVANGADAKITGNLTIKGIAYAVVFPAQVLVSDGIAKMDGRLMIDRTKWDVRYKSGKFYENLADETISDIIEFNVSIVAKK